jgi:hypothetical protein
MNLEESIVYMITITHYAENYSLLTTTINGIGVLQDSLCHLLKDHGYIH